MNLELDKKLVLVTGASRGIGRAIALAFAREGAYVSAVARGERDLARLQDELYKASERPHLTTVADVATRAGADLALRETVGHFGGLDIVVTVVGKSFARDAHELTDDDLASSIETNLTSAAHVAQRAAPVLAQRGGGSITMIASIWGREAGGAPGYNVAKAGVIALGKALARDYARDRVRVNTIAPGSILFPGGGWDRRRIADPVAIDAFVAAEIPSGRFGTVDEVADVVLFVASPRASWVTGTCVPVDGGQSRSF
ncbi:MAG: SDR family NAD(P)-dependent oxidoreductase [Proteobacteria bacterium]|nr:SDR family NAD(P)-dependent oxidoreductase [Pseudomonadota bacterium]